MNKFKNKRVKKIVKVKQYLTLIFLHSVNIYIPHAVNNIQFHNS